MSSGETSAGRGRLSTVLLFAVIAVAVIGYVVGLSDGVPKPGDIQQSPANHADAEIAKVTSEKTIAAIRYSDVPDVSMGPTRPFQAKPVALPSTSDYDPFKKIQPSEVDKVASAQSRSSRRAYNGAPPIIPHAVENTTDSACYACHSGGLKLDGMKASVMSHGYLANCTQCHAPPPPAPFQSITHAVDTSFVGLPAPKAGQRAFPGAPPTIPHSQWMRENCNACHGGPNGWAGMESTHPWRTNCTQCHAPSAVLDQAVPAKKIPMLPPLNVVTQ